MKRSRKRTRPPILTSIIAFNNRTKGLLLIIGLAVPFLFLIWSFVSAEDRAINDNIFVIDDSWIHMEFAKNLIEGNGFSFNPHEPIAASTAPLYTLFVALLYFLLPNHLILAIQVVTVLLTISTIGLTYKITHQLINHRVFSALTALAVSSNPWMAWSALSGMEISLGMFLLTFAVWTYITLGDRNDWKRLVPAFLFALLTLIRPESYSILGVYLSFEVIRIAYMLYKKQITLGYGVKKFTLLTTTILVVIVPYGLFSLITGGSFFPNTYSAKVGSLGISGMFKTSPNLSTLLDFVFTMSKNYFHDYFSALFSINSWIRWSYVPMFGIYLYEAYKSKKITIMLLPAIGLIFPLLVGIMVPTDRISWPWNRHMLYLVPLLILTSFIPTFLLSYRLKTIPMVQAILVAVMMSFTILPLRIRIPEVQKFFVERTQSMNRNHIALVNWVRDNIPSDAVIASSDIGVIGFYTDNYIVDTEGLINPRISGFTHRRNSPEKDAEVLAYLTEKKPDYLVKFSWVYPTFQNERFPLIRNFDTFGIYATPWTRYSTQEPTGDEIR
ncbi:MAG: hypothetical protein NUV98_06845 [Candidatus Roizmanbacteria bacterium]|nr:hypothetical protein [Candidatus Roizmanbacteria bacterium]